MLAHYTADFVIETPLALLLVDESNGRLASKEAVKAYWEMGLKKIPNLEFKILNVLTGINALTIYYLNKATNQKAAEILFFNEDRKVCKAFVHYS
ncbi:hypothetical protein AHMF7616_02810 [Adhaeribacter pallidiroseus]|uniref:Uncharacterized protein n=1 Tax=Adhaeribacter pallidiroseus TaxID=2072847 RepID=A0A369QPQ8_9BACT|nr:hypothetical protein AHMF7616_02810 [Adhaeribacter pallidiroseus]